MDNDYAQLLIEELRRLNENIELLKRELARTSAAVRRIANKP